MRRPSASAVVVPVVAASIAVLFLLGVSAYVWFCISAFVTVVGVLHTSLRRRWPWLQGKESPALRNTLDDIAVVWAIAMVIFGYSMMVGQEDKDRSQDDHIAGVETTIEPTLSSAALAQLTRNLKAYGSGSVVVLNVGNKSKLAEPVLEAVHAAGWAVQYIDNVSARLPLKFSGIMLKTSETPPQGTAGALRLTLWFAGLDVQVEREMTAAVPQLYFKP